MNPRTRDRLRLPFAFALVIGCALARAQGALAERSANAITHPPRPHTAANQGTGIRPARFPPIDRDEREWRPAAGAAG